jgi:hypothetical protein
MGKYRGLGLYACAALAAHAGAALGQDDDDDDDGGGGGRRSGEITCVAELGAVTVNGNVNVVGRCTLSGTDVRGNVTLFSGGSLRARTARIRGNLEGNRADFVDIERTRIDGEVQLEELVGDLSAIELSDVRGNVQLTGNRSRLEILNNELSGDLSVSRNLGGVLISGNAIDDDLRCLFNNPAPTGVGNRVEGETDGQCEDLRPEPAPAAPQPPPPASPPSAPSPSPAPSPAPTDPPATSSPPAAAAPPAATPSATTEIIDEGGAGAMGWLTALLVPLLAWRRRLRR